MGRNLFINNYRVFIYDENAGEFGGIVLFLRSLWFSGKDGRVKIVKFGVLLE